MRTHSFGFLFMLRHRCTCTQTTQTDVAATHWTFTLSYTHTQSAQSSNILYYSWGRKYSNNYELMLLCHPLWLRYIQTERGLLLFYLILSFFSCVYIHSMYVYLSNLASFCCFYLLKWLWERESKRNYQHASHTHTHPPGLSDVIHQTDQIQFC